MPPNLERTRALLQGFDFKTLFIEELGWDRYTTTLDISIDGQNYTLSAIAEKRGMGVFVCEPFVDGGREVRACAELDAGVMGKSVENT